MKSLYSPKTISLLSMLLTLFLVVKVGWFVVEKVFLPAASIDKIEKKQIKRLSYKYKITPSKVKAPEVKREKPRAPKKRDAFADFELVAIYGTNSFCVATINYRSKAHVVAKGEVVGGYTLIGIGVNYALLSKNKKSKKLYFKKAKLPRDVITLVKATQKGKNKTQPTPPPLLTPTPAPTPKPSPYQKKIQKAVLENYMKNMGALERQVAIVPYSKEGKPVGFVIEHVLKGSDIDAIGLQKGDIIIKVNGKPVSNMAEVVAFYGSFKPEGGLKITILRDNNEMELEYEIR